MLLSPSASVKVPLKKVVKSQLAQESPELRDNNV